MFDQLMHSASFNKLCKAHIKHNTTNISFHTQKLTSIASLPDGSSLVVLEVAATAGTPALPRTCAAALCAPARVACAVVHHSHVCYNWAGGTIMHMTIMAMIWIDIIMFIVEASILCTTVFGLLEIAHRRMSTIGVQRAHHARVRVHTILLVHHVEEHNHQEDHHHEDHHNRKSSGDPSQVRGGVVHVCVCVWARCPERVLNGFCLHNITHTYLQPERIQTKMFE